MSKTFRCTYRDGNGKIVTELLTGESQAHVVDTVASRAGLILAITETALEGEQKARRRSRRRIKQDELVMMVRQLATMIDAGMPLLQCLQTLEDQTEPGRLRETLHTLAADVTRGRSFSDALAYHPRVFDKLFVSMVRAGETGGFLAEILERLAVHMESAASLRRKVKAAMMYPAVVVCVAIVVTVLLIVKVIPVFERMFDDFKAELPLPTKLLIGFSHFLRGYGLFVLFAIIAAGFALRWYINTPHGRLQFDRFKFMLPVFGALNRKVSVARFTVTLSTLIESGVPIIRSLEIVSETSGNEIINRVLRDAMHRTEKGEPIADSMKSSKFIPRMVAKMIEVGEATGRLDQMLHRIGMFYTDQVNTAVAGLTALVEPLMIVFLGVMVGGIMLCMFLPIFQLSQVVS
jgi:type IV pilus assembly protein PilC